MDPALLHSGNDGERGEAQLMTDDDFVRACILADELRDLRLKYEGIEDMNATDRLKLAAGMAYREGMSESEVIQVVADHLATLEGRATSAAAPPKSLADDVKQCKACQHATVLAFHEGQEYCAMNYTITDRGEIVDCDDFVRIEAGTRKIGMMGTAYGVSRGKAGR